MTAYYIGQVTVHDAAEYEKYLVQFMDAFLPFEGRVLVSTENVELIEGNWPKSRTVVLEFPTQDHAKRWYASDEYQRIVQHRFKSSDANIVLAEGFNA